MPQDATVSDDYIEVIGNVMDAQNMKMLAATNLGKNLGEQPNTLLEFSRILLREKKYLKI
jgi:hypothetical protein